MSLRPRQEAPTALEAPTASEAPSPRGAGRLDLVLRAGRASRNEPTAAPGVVAPQLVINRGGGGGGGCGGGGGEGGGGFFGNNRRQDPEREERDKQIAAYEAKVKELAPAAGLTISMATAVPKKANPPYEKKNLAFYLEAQNDQGEQVWGTWFLKRKKMFRLGTTHDLEPGNSRLRTPDILMSGTDPNTGRRRAIFLTETNEEKDGYGRDPWPLLHKNIMEYKNALPLNNALLEDWRYVGNLTTIEADWPKNPYFSDNRYTVELALPFENIAKFVFYVYDQKSDSLKVREEVSMSVASSRNEQ